MVHFRRNPKLTFSQRLLRISLWWGVPMVIVELIGVPRRDWAGVLVIIVPATVLGVIAYTLLEHLLVWHGRRSVR